MTSRILLDLVSCRSETQCHPTLTLAPGTDWRWGQLAWSPSVSSCWCRGASSESFAGRRGQKHCWAALPFVSLGRCRLGFLFHMQSIEGSREGKGQRACSMGKVPAGFSLWVFVNEEDTQVARNPAVLLSSVYTGLEDTTTTLF